MTIEGVIFDYGGVLATSPWHAFADFERRHGLEPGGLVPFFAVMHSSGVPAWHAIECGQMPWKDFADQVVANATAAGVDLGDVHDIEGLMPLTALWPMVHRVRRLRADGRHRLGILSNNVREFATYWRSTVPLDLFDVVVDSCEEGIRKPDHEIYRRTASRLGVAPEACVFLDDSADNVRAAVELGMTGIVVDPLAIDGAIASLDAALA
ncbi:MAG TPA: HAD family phosphatase [Acidimicrobiales bacterium]|nr:HAD family phosphatase [Acidimicrobiales bacterium]